MKVQFTLLLLVALVSVAASPTKRKTETLTVYEVMLDQKQVSEANEETPDLNDDSSGYPEQESTVDLLKVRPLLPLPQYHDVLRNTHQASEAQYSRVPEHVYVPEHYPEAERILTITCDNAIETYHTIQINFGETALIYSPDFLDGRRYPSNSNCGWKFLTNKALKLQFSCSVFDLLEGDFLSLRDGPTETRKFSAGSQLNYLTNRNTAFAVFYSNEKDSGQGFNCSVIPVEKTVTPYYPRVALRDAPETERVSVNPRFRNRGEKVFSLLKRPSKVNGIKVSTLTTAVKLVSDVIETSTATTSGPTKYDSSRDESSLKTTSESVTREKTFEKSSSEKTSEKSSSERMNYQRVESISSSGMVEMMSHNEVKTVLDTSGSASVVTRTVFNSTRLSAVSTNIVEKSEEGNGKEFSGFAAHDHTLAPDHRTTSIKERNSSSETKEETDFVRDNSTGEKQQRSTSSTKKSSAESEEIQSSRIDYPDEYVARTPPL